MVKPDGFLLRDGELAASVECRRAAKEFIFVTTSGSVQAAKFPDATEEEIDEALAFMRDCIPEVRVVDSTP